MSWHEVHQFVQNMIHVTQVLFRNIFQQITRKLDTSLLKKYLYFDFLFYFTLFFILFDFTLYFILFYTLFYFIN